MWRKVIALAFAVSFLAGCNTFSGLGKDVERGGEKIEKKADDAKK